MNRRKINDELLQEMLSEGKTYKEIGAAMGVSAAAICKRLQRIQAQTPPESLRALTQKEQHFAMALSRGLTQTQAALAAFDCSSLSSAKSIGSQLANKPEIKMALSELMETHLPQHYRIRKLRNHSDNPDPVISLKALDLSWKLDGSYAPEKHVEIHGDFATISARLEELEAELAALDAAEAAANAN